MYSPTSFVKKESQDYPLRSGNPGLAYNAYVRFACRNAVEPGYALNELPHPQVVFA
jgi:hypothetical protein